jgi:hypothetical protein
MVNSIVPGPEDRVADLANPVDIVQRLAGRIEREVRGGGPIRPDGGRSDAFTLMEDALRSILEPGRPGGGMTVRLVFAEARGEPWLWYDVDLGLVCLEKDGESRKLPVAPDVAWYILQAANKLRGNPQVAE